MSRFNCVKCDNKGSLGTINNLKEDTRFIVKQWYRDDSGLIHTLVICPMCGVFHDCKFSFFGMFIGKPYRALGYLTKKDTEDTINNSLLKRGLNDIDDIALRDAGITHSILEYLYSQGLNLNIKYEKRIREQAIDFFMSK